MAPFIDVPGDCGHDWGRAGPRTCWVGFFWLGYSVLVPKFFTITEGATTTKLLLGVSQGAPSCRKMPALTPSISCPLENHVLSLFLIGVRDGFIPSQSFQGQTHCPRHRFLRRMGEKEVAAELRAPHTHSNITYPSPTLAPPPPRQ